MLDLVLFKIGLQQVHQADCIHFVQGSYFTKHIRLFKRLCLSLVIGDLTNGFGYAVERREMAVLDAIQSCSSSEFADKQTAQSLLPELWMHTNEFCVKTVHHSISYVESDWRCTKNADDLSGLAGFYAKVDGF